MRTEKQIMTPEWLKRYQEIKDLLVSDTNYGELFEKEEIFGKKLFHIDMGEVNFPTGKILVRDPLVYLNKRELPYFQEVPTGKYKLVTLVAEIEEDHYRYTLSRVKFNDEKAVVYREAMIGNEAVEDDLEKGSFFGFAVDAGLATIVDVKTRDAYADFEKEWYEKNPDGNIYDDFFAEEFKKSYNENPEFQREDGDWINFKIPGTDLTVPMIQTGFGDGVYPVYFGYDKNNEVCEVIIEYIFLGEEEE
ncbi:hypothetical protein JCM16774_1366 [Pseudoleptotrichia goodfellowii]|uniref:DUF4241 domain-containing protein n=1 Tax=Pseudoleptotrichia goodfellowii TaxID=157692 RepID=A0A510JB81_9FUSO|nr:hypothetical protein JCM16774_1366 [Pseudoleptotrichia goodfellowii]